MRAVSKHNRVIDQINSITTKDSIVKNKITVLFQINTIEVEVGVNSLARICYNFKAMRFNQR